MTDTAQTTSQHIVCPHCHAVNRVPLARISQSPGCGKCRRLLFNGGVLELAADTFNKHSERSDIPLVVDFWAPWCGPCKMMAPQFAQAAQLLEPHVRLAKVNTESEQALAARFGIRSIPTLMLFHRGRQVASQAGAMGAQDIVGWVQSHLR